MISYWGACCGWAKQYFKRAIQIVDCHDQSICGELVIHEGCHWSGECLGLSNVRSSATASQSLGMLVVGLCTPAAEVLIWAT